MDYEQRTTARIERAVREIVGHAEAPAGGIFLGAPLSTKRRALVRQIGLASRYYGLSEEIDAFLAECDCASLAGLDDRRLRALSSWLGGVMDRLSTGCDHPHSIPAR